MSPGTGSNYREEYVLIAGIPRSASSHAMDALEAAGIEFGGRRGRGSWGVRVKRSEVVRAREILAADAREHDYEIRFAP